jgi:ADP-dependent NAD(P)H-hydrate dehydratase
MKSTGPPLPFGPLFESISDCVERMLGEIPPPPSHLSRRSRHSHKGDFGRVLLVGGRRGMAGAIGIAAASCVKSGAGLVSAAIPDRCLETVAGINPCFMTIPLADTSAGEFGSEAADQFTELSGRFDVLAMGPGMGVGSGAEGLVARFLEQKHPRVLDADGLNVLAGIDDWVSRTAGCLLLTPHPGEWQRLSGVSMNDRAAQQEAAKKAAATFGGVILLKGASTFVTDGKRDYFNTTGNPGMATGGSGDCLTGLLGALLGQGCSAWEAATLGAWIHGLAGDLASLHLGQAGMTAMDIVCCLPWAVGLALET